MSAPYATVWKIKTSQKLWSCMLEFEQTLKGNKNVMLYWFLSLQQKKQVKVHMLYLFIYDLYVTNDK